MGTMSRQREAQIQDGLAASAGDIDAELDHIVAQHNDAEGRLVTAEADIVINEDAIADNAEDIVELQAVTQAGSEVYTGTGTYNYDSDNERTFVVNSAAYLEIAMEDPAMDTDAWVPGVVVHIVNGGSDVVGVTGQFVVDGITPIQIAVGSEMTLTVVDDGVSDYEWLVAVTNGEAPPEPEIALASSVLVSGSHFNGHIFINEDSPGAYTVTLPVISASFVGKTVTVCNTGLTQVDVVRAGGSTQPIMSSTNWRTTGGTTFVLQGGESVVLLACPEQKWESQSTTYTNSYGWAVISSDQ